MSKRFTIRSIVEYLHNPRTHACQHTRYWDVELESGKRAPLALVFERTGSGIVVVYPEETATWDTLAQIRRRERDQLRDFLVSSGVDIVHFEKH